METNFGYLKSVTLGINLDGNLCPMEAGYIATEVLTGIGIIGCCGLYVTHIHDLTQQLDVYNSHPENRGKIDNLVAMMESKEEWHPKLQGDPNNPGWLKLCEGYCQTV